MFLNDEIKLAKSKFCNKIIIEYKHVDIWNRNNIETNNYLKVMQLEKAKYHTILDNKIKIINFI